MISLGWSPKNVVLNLCHRSGRGSCGRQIVRLVDQRPRQRRGLQRLSIRGSRLRRRHVDDDRALGVVAAAVGRASVIAAAPNGVDSSGRTRRRRTVWRIAGQMAASPVVIDVTSSHFSDIFLPPLSLKHKTFLRQINYNDAQTITNTLNTE